MKATQMARIVEFDRLVRGNYYPNVARFSRDYEVSKRTVMRDINFLRNSLGALIAYNVTRKGFYYTENWDAPKILTNCATRAQQIFQLIKGLKALSPSDRLHVINSVGFQEQPAPSEPSTGLMSFQLAL